MRLLGVDFGEKRIGIALSDESGAFAFPKEIIPNTKSTFERIREIIKEEDVEEIVVGESVNKEGGPNKVEEKIKLFVEELKERFNLPIHRQKEFMTSVEARRGPNDKANSNVSRLRSKINADKVDAKAAALILQRYLDKKNTSI